MRATFKAYEPRTSEPGRRPPVHNFSRTPSRSDATIRRPPLSLANQATSYFDLARSIATREVRRTVPRDGCPGRRFSIDDPRRQARRQAPHRRRSTISQVAAVPQVPLRAADAAPPEFFCASTDSGSDLVGLLGQGGLDHDASLELITFRIALAPAARARPQGSTATGPDESPRGSVTRRPNRSLSASTRAFGTPIQATQRYAGPSKTPGYPHVARSDGISVSTASDDHDAAGTVPRRTENVAARSTPGHPEPPGSSHMILDASLIFTPIGTPPQAPPAWTCDDWVGGRGRPRALRWAALEAEMGGWPTGLPDDQLDNDAAELRCTSGHEPQERLRLPRRG